MNLSFTEYSMKLFWVLMLALLGWRLIAQDPPRPEFEVASIKPVEPNVPSDFNVRVEAGARVRIVKATLKDLIAVAFALPYWQISGADPWMEKDLYIVEARPPEDQRSSIKTLRYSWSGIADQHLREMLQAMLIDRFQLKFHRETKTGDIYLLQRGVKALQLRPTEVAAPAEGSEDHRANGNIGYAQGKWRIVSATIPELANFGSSYVLHAPVLDRTELRGQFDYKQPQPDVEPRYGDDPSRFMSLIAALGLKLERTKGPVEVFVIDHAAKPEPN
jgi:uncharacterized protein (TIGR03435 family)